MKHKSTISKTLMQDFADIEKRSENTTTSSYESSAVTKATVVINKQQVLPDPTSYLM